MRLPLEDGLEAGQLLVAETQKRAVGIDWDRANQRQTPVKAGQWAQLPVSSMGRRGSISQLTNTNTQICMCAGWLKQTCLLAHKSHGLFMCTQTHSNMPSDMCTPKAVYTEQHNGKLRGIEIQTQLWDKLAV